MQSDAITAKEHTPGLRCRILVAENQPSWPPWRLLHRALCSPASSGVLGPSMTSKTSPSSSWRSAFRGARLGPSREGRTLSTLPGEPPRSRTHAESPLAGSGSQPTRSPTSPVPGLAALESRLHRRAWEHPKPALSPSSYAQGHVGSRRLGISRGDPAASFCLGAQRVRSLSTAASCLWGRSRYRARTSSAHVMGGALDDVRRAPVALHRDPALNIVFQRLHLNAAHVWHHWSLVVHYIY